MFGKRKNTPGPQVEPGKGVPLGLLQTSLLLEEVSAPELADFFPDPVSLAVGLHEFVVLEGVTIREADLLLRLAATMRRPAAGRIFHWGRDLFSLSRQALYPWRRRLAFVSPFQSLLPRLTVEENVTLSQTLKSHKTANQVAQEQHQLLQQLALWEYLPFYPGDLPLQQYHLALWARELIKEPILIMGILAGQAEECDSPALGAHLLPWLEDYHHNRRGAVLLAGPQLDFTYHLADRRLGWRDGRRQEQPLPGRAHQPLIAYLDLF
jgi:ABC-type lipoprotein export system ATPase subunit